MRSLFHKVDQISSFIKRNNFSILAINETWLDESISDNEISIHGYDILRCDRNRLGGGTCMYIKHGLKYKLLEKIYDNIAESIWVLVESEKDKLVVGCMYRPPSADSAYYNSMLDQIEKARMVSEDMVLLGDLNFDYKFDESLSTNPIKYMEELYCLQQLVTEPTRTTLTSSTILDIILTSVRDKHTKTKVLKVSLSDHYPVFTILRWGSKGNLQRHKEITFRDYKNFDENNFLQDLSNANILTEQFEESTFIDRWIEFKRVFTSVCDKHVPLVTRRMKNRYNPWITSDIVKLMYDRDHVKTKAQDLKDKVLWDEYTRLRNQVTSLIHRRKKEYYENEITEKGSNPQKMWKIIDRITKNDNKNQPCIIDNVSANQFNEYFCSIGPTTVDNIPEPREEIPWKGPVSRAEFRFSYLNTDDVEKRLKSLGIKSNVDVLGFDAKLLSLSARILAPFVTKLFNASITMKVIPDDWKFARVSPIYKGKGDKKVLGNYRPISVITHIAKILEKEMQRQLLTYLVENEFITIDQSAYRQYHNTQTSLHRVVDDWIENICDGVLTGVCLLDIRKCFDTIDHHILLQKLEFYGIKNNEAAWFKSYLENRAQVVNLNGELSDKNYLSLGVPQGSVLGPILFMLYVNDLSRHVYLGSANLYADDTIIYCTGNTIEEVNSKLQICINHASQWYRGNRLVLNSEKSNTILISSRAKVKQYMEGLSTELNEHLLEQTTSVDYLGVRIDHILSWDDHVSRLCKTLSFKVSRLARLRRSTPKSVLFKIYNSIIQPSIDYAITVWGHTTAANITKVQRIQNYAARILSGNFDYINCRGIDIVKNLGWMNIVERRRYFDCVLMFKCLHGLAPDYLANQFTFHSEISDRENVRFHPMDVYIPFPRLELFRNTFLYNGAVLWNDLPNGLKECTTLDAFKRGLKALIRNS